MANGKHSRVSSESREGAPIGARREAGAPHEAVAGAGVFEDVGVPPEGRDLIAEEFGGDFGGAAEIENVPGFDAGRGRALGEGIGVTQAVITEDLAALRECAECLEVAESVCGRDDRVRISPATEVPWRWNCQLIITMANGGQSRCTGWFFGPCVVMAAGHCVYSHGAGGWARSIEVIPGMDGANRPFGSQVGTSFRSVLGWTRDRDENYDYGAIVLPNSNLGRRVGWFGFAALSDSSLANLLVNNAGYAGDKPFGTLWFNAGRITNVTARKIYYMIDTYGGHSGSPVWRLLNGERHAVGIHAYGGCPNSATRIVTPVFDNMLSWRNECR